MLRGSTREVYKLSREVVKEVTSIYIGPIGYSIIEYCVETGVYTFTSAHIVEYLIAKGYARREDKEKLHKRVHDAIKRLMSRGFIARISYGWYKLLYKLLLDPGRVNLRVALLPSLVKNGEAKGGVKEVDGTREPHGFGVGFGGCGFVFLDNVRGVRVGGGYVHGDRGRVICFGDLGRFSSVSYAEVSSPSFSRFLEGRGVVVLYFGGKVVECVSNSGCHGGFVVSDWFEWRPPGGYYGGRTPFDARRELRERVVPYVLAVLLRVARGVGVSVVRLARVIWAMHRELYYFVKKRGFRGFSDGVIMGCVDRCTEGYLSRPSYSTISDFNPGLGPPG